MSIEMESKVDVFSATLLVVFLHLMTKSASIAHATMHTYVSNESSKPIEATIIYVQGYGSSGFKSRLITPGTYQRDDYYQVNIMRVELWVKGTLARADKNVTMGGDRSLVAYDNPDGNGVDIFLSRQGTRIVRDGASQITIYPARHH